jgi:methylthioribose-1-phosphate isomerase
MIVPFKTVEWVDGDVVLLDQTRLPEEEVYVSCTAFEEVARAIETMVVRGAPVIGITAAYGVALAAHRGEPVRAAVERLRRTRPTAVNLGWALDRMTSVLSDCSDKKSIARSALSEAELIHREDAEACDGIGRNGAALFERSSESPRILTHCNAGALATGGIGTALGIVYTLAENGRSPVVYFGETRPLLQGARLTAWELRQIGVEAVLQCDSAAGSLFDAVKLDAVIVGADRITLEGDVFNKVGTYALAVLAARHNVPFYVAAPLSSFDVRTSSEDVLIEQRGEDEVRGFGKTTVTVADQPVRNPAFDRTPAELIGAYISEAGVARSAAGFRSWFEGTGDRTI